MPIDFNRPSVTEVYNTQFAPGIQEAVRALGKQLDGETITNPIPGLIRWSSANSYWERFNGSVWAELATPFVKTSQYTAADVLTKLLTVDGPGSGLDAALLGGAGPAFYTDIPSRLGYAPVNRAGDTLTGRLVQHVNGFQVATKDDLTTRTDSGWYETASATTAEGWPLTTGGWMHLFSSTHSNTSNYYAFQIAADFASQRFFMRSVSDAGARAWSELWHGSNFNPASKADLASPNFTGTPLHNSIEIGYRSVPRSNTSGTAVVADRGRCIAIAANLTLPASVFGAGDAVSLYNDSGAAVTIVQGAGLTLRQAGTAATGNRTLAARGLATVWFNSAAEAIISGAGLS